MDLDWGQICAGTLFDFEYEITQAAVKLLRLDAERTVDNQPATQYTLLEKAIQAFAHYNVRISFPFFLCRLFDYSLHF